MKTKRVKKKATINNKTYLNIGFGWRSEYKNTINSLNIKTT